MNVSADSLEMVQWMPLSPMLLSGAVVIGIILLDFKYDLVKHIKLRKDILKTILVLFICVGVVQVYYAIFMDPYSNVLNVAAFNWMNESGMLREMERRKHVITPGLYIATALIVGVMVYDLIYRPFIKKSNDPDEKHE